MKTHMRWVGPGTPSRRSFLKSLSAGAGALVCARAASSATARIEVLPDETVASISPEIYGHFVEHIGGVVYDGIWVGAESKIANEGGIRKQLLDHLRLLNPPVIRWPGGCFADSYNWRDGIGPRAQRPRRVNFWINDPGLAKAPDGPQKFEPNQFGTHEFARFAKLAGAKPYLAANLRSLPAESFQEWVEYCNAPAHATSLAEMRAANGAPEPFGVSYWGVGNESWGCGGDLLPGEYASEFRRYTSFVPSFSTPLHLVASGPNGGDLNWTRGFFSKLAEKGTLGRVWGWALHYYCGGGISGQAIDFPPEDWYQLLASADRMESLIEQHWAAMGEFDADHHTRLVVDEWGAWYRAGTEVDPAYLFGQTPTLRDALISGLTLDTFNRHADKVGMANVAQLVNNLHALFLAREDQFTVTPNYHVFRMYSSHAGATAVRSVFSAPSVSFRAGGKTSSMRGLAGSASIRGNKLVITAVNPDASRECVADIAVRGRKIAAGSATVLSSSDLHAHNSFAAPHALEPVTDAVDTNSGVYAFRPASVTRLDLTMV